MSRRLATAVFAIALGLSAANGRSQAQQGTHPAQIDRNGTLILIRSSLIALEEANETGNYTVLRDLASPGFREANDATRLGEIFANLRHQNVDLSGVLVLDPQLTTLPQIDDKGLLHMAGFFPSVPTQVNFDLAYAPVNGRWRLFGVGVRLGSSSPVAPSPPPEAPIPAKPLPAPSKPQKLASSSKSGTNAADAAKAKRKLHPTKPSEVPKLEQPNSSDDETK